MIKNYNNLEYYLSKISFIIIVVFCLIYIKYDDNIEKIRDYYNYICIILIFFSLSWMICLYIMNTEKNKIILLIQFIDLILYIIGFYLFLKINKKYYNNKNDIIFDYQISVYFIVNIKILLCLIYLFLTIIPLIIL